MSMEFPDFHGGDMWLYRRMPLFVRNTGFQVEKNILSRTYSQMSKLLSLLSFVTLVYV